MTPPLLPFDPSEFDAQAMQAVISMSESLGRTICIARALVENGRTIDLAGLDHGVGLLCAKALDLPTEAGTTARQHLLAVLDEADALTAALETYAVP